MNRKELEESDEKYVATPILGSYYDGPRPRKFGEIFCKDRVYTADAADDVDDLLCRNQTALDMSDRPCFHMRSSS